MFGNIGKSFQPGGMFSPGPNFGNRLSTGLEGALPWIAAATAPTRSGQLQAIGGALNYSSQARERQQKEQELAQWKSAAAKALANEDLPPEIQSMISLSPEMAGRFILERYLPKEPRAPNIETIGGYGYNADTGEWLTPPGGVSQGDVSPGFQWTGEGGQSFIPGGPHDPEQVQREAVARGEGRPTRPLPQSAINKMGEAGSSLESFERLSTTFEDDYGGKVSDTLGETQNWAGRNIPGSTKERQDQAQFWQDYQATKNTIRHTLFGSALTATEKAEFDRAMISPGMTPQQIKTNLARQVELAKRAARKLAGVYAAQGYPPEAIEAAIGYPLEELGISVPGEEGGAGDDGGNPWTDMGGVRIREKR